MNCNVEVSKEFKFAISSNRCPACSKQIINAGNMTAFPGLCQSIETFLTNADGYGLTLDSLGLDTGTTLGSDLAGKVAESLATKLITSFNINMPGEKGKGNRTSADIEVYEDEQSVSVDPETGIRLESFDKRKSQTALQKARDEALQEALADQGMEFGAQVLLSDNPIVNTLEAVQRQKQLAAQEKIANGGAPGGVRRSG
jgi:hypothetical protein